MTINIKELVLILALLCFVLGALWDGRAGWIGMFLFGLTFLL